ncbi:diaminobutyrate acetyltransferase [Haloechinothrix alba]|uniref:L-2,4-diaminobutyric acid acetyltransferase n=1 Tax=Haloechinothrix alba TaxID=664784 RepID=A0A238WUF6_9PSEU|nr:diaminobutyrate acetyltransferase [Haloechinothrix alba]SNR50155.1 diaminobutyrate acetyltransferase [Haloechinothrix alba]
MSGSVTIERPTKADGAALWRVARDSGKLDLNSPYTYLLWCQDFADTSVVARDGDDVVGFVIGYRRPRDPSTAMVWQVAVDASQRGEGLAGRMLDVMYTGLVADGVRYLATTVTPDNEASIALFRSFATRWGAEMTSVELFAATDFPAEHEAEDLYEIGPLGQPPAG